MIINKGLRMFIFSINSKRCLQNWGPVNSNCSYMICFSRDLNFFFFVFMPCVSRFDWIRQLYQQLFWYLLLTLRVLVLSFSCILDVLPSSLSFIFYVVLCNSKGKVNWKLIILNLCEWLPLTVTNWTSRCIFFIRLIFC